MTGRLSLDKAKAIKEKREFAQELDDVVTFNAKVNRDGSSNKRKESVATAQSRGELDTDASSDAEKEEEEEAVPVKRRVKVKSVGTRFHTCVQMIAELGSKHQCFPGGSE
jgi:hypothetical protein